MTDKTPSLKKRKKRKRILQPRKQVKITIKKGREPTLIGYMRVSTDKQDHALQYEALIDAGVDPKNIFKDTISGKKITREGLSKCLKFCIQGDTLLVWKIDRFSRKTKDMLELLEGLDKRGISIKSITQPFDTSNAAGKMMLQILAIFAEFEREVIRERITAGIKSVREKDKRIRWGKQPESEYDPVEIRRLRRQGMKVREIALQCGVSTATVSRCCAPQKERKDVYK